MSSSCSEIPLPLSLAVKQSHVNGPCAELLPDQARVPRTTREGGPFLAPGPRELEQKEPQGGRGWGGQVEVPAASQG